MNMSPQFESIPAEIPVLFGNSIETFLMEHNDVRVLSTPFAAKNCGIKTLDLSRNGMESVERNTIENLKSLALLNLACNFLTRLPAGFLDSYGMLRELRLFQNKLVELPSLAALSSLVILDVHNNSLSLLPDDLAECRNLQCLRVNANALVALPDGMPSLQRLQVLAAGDNLLANLPVGFEMLTALHELDLSYNRFHKIPPAVMLLPTLFHCTFEGNELVECDVIELSATHFSTLTAFYCGMNSVARLGGTLAYWEGLTVLDLRSNNLSRLPADVTCLCNLRTLTLSMNSLTELPDGMRALTSLTDVDLSWNRLRALPADLGAVPHLRVLRVAYNDLVSLMFDGAAPVTNALVELSVQGNRIATVPDWLGRQTELSVLQLASNELAEFPPVLCALTKLQRLSLGGNAAISTIPSDMGSFTALIDLDVSGCRLTSVPRSLAQLPAIKHISLRGNAGLADIISSTAAALARMRVSLRLEGTRLVEIPGPFLTNPASRQPPPGVCCLSGRVPSGSAGLIPHAVSDSIGGRPYMEDVTCVAALHVAATNESYSFFGLFDGHAGLQTAAWLGTNMAPYVGELLNSGVSPQIALLAACEHATAELRNATDGSTGTMILWGAESVTVSCVGDSRAVFQLSAEGLREGADLRTSLDTAGFSTTHYARRHGRSDTVRVTTDHNVNKMGPAEYLRIRKAGGYVVADGYVNDSIAVSRSFGDAALHPVVISVPDVVEIPTRLVTGFVLASDGLWDALTDSAAIAIAAGARGDLDVAARAMVTRALFGGSNDNISVVCAGSFTSYAESTVRLAPAEPPLPAACAGPAAASHAALESVRQSRHHRRRHRKRRDPRSGSGSSADERGANGSSAELAALVVRDAPFRGPTAPIERTSSLVEPASLVPSPAALGASADVKTAGRRRRRRQRGADAGLGATQSQPTPSGRSSGRPGAAESSSPGAASSPHKHRVAGGSKAVPVAAGKPRHRRAPREHASSSDGSSANLSISCTSSDGEGGCGARAPNSSTGSSDSSRSSCSSSPVVASSVGPTIQSVSPPSSLVTPARHTRAHGVPALSAAAADRGSPVTRDGRSLSSAVKSSAAAGAPSTLGTAASVSPRAMRRRHVQSDTSPSSVSTSPSTDEHSYGPFSSSCMSPRMPSIPMGTQRMARESESEFREPHAAPVSELTTDNPVTISYSSLSLSSDAL